MDAIYQLRKNILSDWLDKALRKIEQVLIPTPLPFHRDRSGPVNGIMDGKSMDETSDIKNTKEREASFLKALDDHRGIIDKICRAYCNTRADREDLCQEIVYQLWKAYPSFTGDSKISTWIYQVALRSAIMPFRRKRRIKTELHEVLPERAGEEPYEGIDDRLFNIFHRLGNFERAALVMIGEGYTREEIGTLLGINKEALHKRVSRAMKAIENYRKK